MRRQAGKAGVPRTGRSDTAPCRPPATGAESPNACRAGRSKACSYVHPLVQCGCAAWIDGQVVDESRNTRVVPRLAEIAPDLGKRLRAQVAAHERQRVDELHQ